MNICYINENYETVITTKEEALASFGSEKLDWMIAAEHAWESYGGLWETCSRLEVEDLVDRYNTWCDDNRYDDPKIYRMNDLEDIFYNVSAEEAFNMALYGYKRGYSNLRFDTTDEYFIYDGYGRIVSMMDIDAAAYISEYSEFDIQEALKEIRKEWMS